jgi:phospholipid/cholesterol/gamma-HCH transport system substrate-binding protein
MSDKTKNVLIGLFTLMSIIIIIGTILFLQPSIGDGKKTLNVRFSNISGIHLGTRVTFAGKPVGEVEEIKEVDTAKKDRIEEYGKIYYYQLKLKIDSSVELYDCDVIAIQTTGLMGEKSIGITPLAFSKNKESKKVTDEIFYAKASDSIESTADQICKLSDKAEKAVDNFNLWFEKNSTDLSSSISSISHLLKSLDNQKIVDSLNQSINSFQKSMNYVTQALQTATENNTFNKLNLIVDNLTLTSQVISSEGKEAIENLNLLSKNLTNPKGSIGKILSSDDLYLNFNAIISKANTLFNDINNYGLLFQYSKGWQRLRTQRASVLESLNNPKDFKSFFETEVADITASLSRINQLVSKAENSSQKQKILSSQVYRKNFSYLLRQVESLMNMIKLYNEDLLNKSNAQ